MNKLIGLGSLDAPETDFSLDDDVSRYVLLNPESFYLVFGNENSQKESTEPIIAASSSAHNAIQATNGKNGNQFIEFADGYNDLSTPAAYEADE